MPNPLPAISEADIRDIAGDTVFERGWNYFRQSAVFEPARPRELSDGGGTAGSGARDLPPAESVAHLGEIQWLHSQRKQPSPGAKDELRRVGL